MSKNARPVSRPTENAGAARTETSDGLPYAIRVKYGRGEIIRAVENQFREWNVITDQGVDTYRWNYDHHIWLMK